MHFLYKHVLWFYCFFFLLPVPKNQAIISLDYRPATCEHPFKLIQINKRIGKERHSHNSQTPERRKTGPQPLVSHSPSPLPYVLANTVETTVGLARSAHHSKSHLQVSSPSASRAFALAAPRCERQPSRLPAWHSTNQRPEHTRRVRRIHLLPQFRCLLGAKSSFPLPTYTQMNTWRVIERNEINQNFHTNTRTKRNNSLIRSLYSTIILRWLTQKWPARHLSPSSHLNPTTWLYILPVKLNPNSTPTMKVGPLIEARQKILVNPSGQFLSIIAAWEIMLTMSVAMSGPAVADVPLYM